MTRSVNRLTSTFVHRLMTRSVHIPNYTKSVKRRVTRSINRLTTRCVNILRAKWVNRLRIISVNRLVTLEL